MEHRIETIPEKKLVGLQMTMSFSNNKTFELWSSFMPRRKEIQNKTGTELHSIQVYSPLFFSNYNTKAEFEKQAAIEVTDLDTIPEGMQPFILPGGLYAVFLYKGAANDAAKTFKYILGTWLPNSEYLLDNRPHFEILGEKYRRDDPDSEEEIWIPICKK